MLCYDNNITNSVMSTKIKKKGVHKIMTGSEVKEKITTAGLKLWQVAYAYGVTDSHFSRLLRKDFTYEQTSKILSIIEELKTKQ